MRSMWYRLGMHKDLHDELPHRPEEEKTTRLARPRLERQSPTKTDITPESSRCGYSLLRSAYLNNRVDLLPFTHLQNKDCAQRQKDGCHRENHAVSQCRLPENICQRNDQPPEYRRNNCR